MLLTNTPIHRDSPVQRANTNNINQAPQQNQQSQASSFRPTPQFAQQILSLLIQLIQLLLKSISQPKPEPKPLALSPSQQDNLKQVLGINPNAPFSVEVLDSDGNGKLSSGDTAIVSGGITGGEIQRKTLTDEDIKQINTPKGNLPEDFSNNLQKWQSFTGGPDEFLSYTTQQSCFCPREFTRPMNITESNGQITSATYADTGETVPDNIRQSLQTVDQRFEQLRNAYESGADQVNVTYDPQFGYPTSVFIDQSQLIADEEISYSISNLGIALP